MALEGTDAQLAKLLLTENTVGYLSTLTSDPPGYPFGSVLPYVVDSQGNPVFMVSALAEHTKNFLADPRASLLVAEQPRANLDPLALQRATLIGRVEPASAEEVRDSYLRVHTSARNSSEMQDFSFYRLVVERVRYVGGFGRMSWVDPLEFAAVAEI